ncbi:hypothetical protein SpCBS45565_g07916 [Spizellomyces sp. 'palustris']|nr:hypothetical protein SpCBS45565_g07916 [Spizellomyces sp. 'palustris']
MTAINPALSFPREPPLPPIRGILGTETGDSGRNSMTRQSTPFRPSTFNQDPVGTASDNTGFSSKLTIVEAQRIMSVLVEAQRKVQLIGLLPDVMDRRMATVFSGDTFTAITEIRQLEDKYNALLANKEEDSPSRVSVSSDLKDSSRQIRQATRSLVRHFLQNPAATSKLRYLKSTKLPSVARFEQLLQEVKMLVYERLGTTVEEERAKQDQLSIIIAKEQKTSNEVKALREELDKARKERTTDINKKNEIIRRLKEELREIKQQAEETTKRLEARSKQKEDSDIQQFRDRETSLKQEITNHQSQLEELVKRNGEEEAQLRKRKFKIESEVENWIHKYDQDMDEKQTELEDITAIYLEEKAQLDELTARHSELRKEYEAIMEERRVEEEKEKAR